MHKPYIPVWSIFSGEHMEEDIVVLEEEITEDLKRVNTYSAISDYSARHIEKCLGSLAKLHIAKMLYEVRKYDEAQEVLKEGKVEVIWERGHTDLQMAYIVVITSKHSFILRGYFLDVQSPTVRVWQEEDPDRIADARSMYWTRHREDLPPTWTI